MENIDFMIDSKDKSNLSKGYRMFHYGFGLFLIVINGIIISRFIKANSFDLSFYLCLVMLLTGILWIIRGLIGRDFMRARKYISLTKDSIHLKKAFKDDIRLSSNSIDLISIKPTKLNVKTKDDSVDFDLTWLNFNELQQLRTQFVAFGNLNKVEIK